MRVVARWALGLGLAAEALYLGGILAVALPFAATMDRFEDGARNLWAYGGTALVLVVAVAVVGVAALATLMCWTNRPDRVRAARAVVGSAALLNLGGVLAASALAWRGEAFLWGFAAAWALATGVGCAWHRNEPLTA